MGHALGAMLAGQPFAITPELHPPSPWSLGPVAFPWLDINQQVQRPPRAAIRDLHIDPRLGRHSVEQSGTDQSSPAIRIRLSTNPTVCRSGKPKSTFSMRQTWIAASENVSGRPRLPVLPACQTMSGSNQTESEPRWRSAALQSDRFVVR